MAAHEHAALPSGRVVVDEGEGVGLRQQPLDGAVGLHAGERSTHAVVDQVQCAVGACAVHPPLNHVLALADAGSSSGA